MTQYRALKTPPVFWPALLQLHAAVLGLAGRPDDGLARVDEALDVVAALPEPQPRCSSELLLLKGKLLPRVLERPGGSRDVVRAAAVQTGDRLEAPMLQLAATALARLWCTQGKTEPASTC